MSGRIAQILAQALILGGGVMIKAFVEAYQKVAANPEAAKAAAEQAKRSTTTFLRNEMSVKEAQDILNLPNKPTLTELNERYDRYFNANDPKKGGSFYVQSKIYRAREALEKAIGLESQEQRPSYMCKNVFRLDMLVTSFGIFVTLTHPIPNNKAKGK